MNKILVASSAFLLLLLACQREVPQNALFLKNPSPLRTEPGLKAPVIRDLSTEEWLIDLGTIAEPVTAIKIEGRLIEAPWLKVRTAQNDSGWVWTGALDPTSPQQLEDWLEQAVWGTTLYSELQSWRAEKAQLRTAEALAGHWHRGIELREACLEHLIQKRSPYEGPVRDPVELFAGTLPGFVIQRIQRPPGITWFADFRVWDQLAKATPEKSDDAWLAIMLQSFSSDSIESRYPDWWLPESEGRVYNKLGSGVHFSMLKAINDADGSDNPFAPDINRWKTTLVNDLLNKHTKYWYPGSAIRSELDSILQQPGWLSEQEAKALSLQREAFNDPEAHGIQLNWRSGEPEGTK